MSEPRKNDKNPENKTPPPGPEQSVAPKTAIAPQPLAELELKPPNPPPAPRAKTLMAVFSMLCGFGMLVLTLFMNQVATPLLIMVIVASLLITCFGMVFAIHDPARRQNAIGEVFTKSLTIISNAVPRIIEAYMDKKQEGQLRVVETVSTRVEELTTKIVDKVSDGVKGFFDKVKDDIDKKEEEEKLAALKKENHRLLQANGHAGEGKPEENQAQALTASERPEGKK